MTHYEILGVSKTASQEEIRSAYKTLIKKYHPDLYQGDKSFAEKKTKEINEAYDTLSDSNKRSVYDFEIAPKTYNTTYEYTPPKYEYTPPKYNYYNNNYSTYESRYNRPNYKRSYNNYSNQQTQNTSANDPINQAYNTISKRLKINLLTIIMVLFIYLSIFLSTIMQYKNYQKIQSEKNKTTQPVQNTIVKEPELHKEFDINDYFTDSELREIYNNSYRNVFDNFSDFKDAFSIYFEMYYTY